MRIGILGAGTWGIALARMLSNHDHQVLVWSALEQEITSLSKNRIHPNLPYMTIPSEVMLTKEIQEACKTDILIIAVPSVYVRDIITKAAPYIESDCIIVIVTKGIETGSLLTMSEVVEDELKHLNKYNPVVVLSGPTHAEEVARDMPTAIISASSNDMAARVVQNTFTNDFFRVYTNSDIKGVELCGAIKNVIALATGIATGLGFGDNARAALITRGMAEITRLGQAIGCNMETFYGLAGIGDLIVTATSQHSRNNRAGTLIGQGYSIEEAKKTVGMVVEGLNTLPAAVQLAKEYGVEMPIVTTVEMIVSGMMPVKEAVNILMKRETKEEKPY